MKSKMEHLAKAWDVSKGEEGAIVLTTVCFSMVRIGNSEKHAVIARGIARMSFRIHGIPDIHFYSIAADANDVLKGHGGR